MAENDLCGQLLKSERVSPELEARYKQEMQNMIERKLKPYERVAWNLSALMGVGFFVGFGYEFLYVMRLEVAFPLWAKATFAAGSLFGLVWAVLGARMVRKGSFHLRKDANLFFGLVWGFVVLLMTCSLLVGSQMPDTAKGNQMILSGLVFLVMFGVTTLLQREITQAELRTREQLLRMETTLTELAEQITRGRARV